MFVIDKHRHGNENCTYSHNSANEQLIARAAVQPDHRTKVSPPQRRDKPTYTADVV